MSTWIFGGLATLVLLALAGVAWVRFMARRRMDQAVARAAAESAQAARQGGGGPTRPVVPK